MKTPYPGKYETHESWMRRCDAAERRQSEENEARYNSSPDGRGLSEKQKVKLKKAEAKLPEGMHYWVTNDNQQLGLRSDVSTGGDLALATKEKWGISGQVYANGAEGAWLSLLLNRACAAVWGKQPVWGNWDAATQSAVAIFSKDEYAEAEKMLKKVTSGK